MDSKLIKQSKKIKDRGGKTSSSESKTARKRRVAPVINDSDGSSSSSDAPENKQAATGYSFSNHKSFKNIFSDVQCSLRGPIDVDGDDSLMSKFQDDPIMKSYLKNKKASSGTTATTGTSKKTFSTKGLDLPSSSKSSGSSNACGSRTVPIPTPSSSLSTLDTHVTPAQLAVADLDTDTELDIIEEIPAAVSVSKSKARAKPQRGRGRTANKKNARPKRSGKVIDEIEIPSDDDPDALEAEFTHFMASKTKVTDTPTTPPPKSTYIPPRMDLSPSVFLPDSPDVGGSMRIRIKYRGTLYTFPGTERSDVEIIRRKLSELTGVPEMELLIYNEEEKKMMDGKTLTEYGVGPGNILDALRHKIQKPTHVLPSEGGITLKFQMGWLKQPIHMSVSKYKSLKEIRAMLALDVKEDENFLDFKFDGDVVALTSTPDDLDMEDDDCIDVFKRSA